MLSLGRTPVGVPPPFTFAVDFGGRSFCAGPSERFIACLQFSVLIMGYLRPSLCRGRRTES